MSAVYTLIWFKLNFASPVITFLPVKIKVEYQYSIKGFTDFAFVQSLLIFCVISLTISTYYLQTSPKPFCKCLAFWFALFPLFPVFERLLHINSEDAKNATSPENMTKLVVQLWDLANHHATSHPPSLSSQINLTTLAVLPFKISFLSSKPQPPDCYSPFIGVQRNNQFISLFQLKRNNH